MYLKSCPERLKWPLSRFDQSWTSWAWQNNLVQSHLRVDVWEGSHGVVQPFLNLVTIRRRCLLTHNQGDSNFGNAIFRTVQCGACLPGRSRSWRIAVPYIDLSYALHQSFFKRTQRTHPRHYSQLWKPVQVYLLSETEQHCMKCLQSGVSQRFLRQYVWDVT